MSDAADRVNRVAADLLTAAVEENLARTNYSAVLASRGITTVSLDDDGRIIEHRPDGTVSAVDTIRRP